MATSAALVDTLKRELRARRLTYAAVAHHLGVAEVTVKRMFSRGEFTLERLDSVCALLGMEFSDLARTLSREHAVISALTPEQEKEFVANHKLMLMALCTLNHWTFEEIISFYDLGAAEAVKLLARLEKLKFIELLPNNRIRLLVSRAFAWLPDGPIQQFFKTQAHDFFAGRFGGEEELLLMINGALSRASMVTLKARLKRIAAEFADMRTDDAVLPFAERNAVSMLLAIRPWEAAFLNKFRRKAVLPVPGATLARKRT